MNGIVLTTFLDVVAWIMIVGFLVLALGVFIGVFTDIFKRRDLSGLGKAGWIVFLVVLPFIAALIYLATRPRTGGDVDDPVIAWAPAKGAMSPVDELAYAHGLLEKGTITQEQFEDVKRHLGF